MVSHQLVHSLKASFNWGEILSLGNFSYRIRRIKEYIWVFPAIPTPKSEITIELFVLLDLIVFLRNESVGA